MNLPEAKEVRVEQKRFYFDVGNNNRGVFLRLSEVWKHVFFLWEGRGEVAKTLLQCSYFKWRRLNNTNLSHLTRKETLLEMAGRPIKRSAKAMSISK